ncbi:type I-B CRISPR-associated endonuclease Cas1b [Saccharicrinis fermentans]|uniref:CRISPR-associated endonuclease Cas1 n=1 Tax=Saccharicrinis fermentans DSM 9555 = JCM 21142 TaxID=869213 RepID=W7Y5M2_9BACT|nr:type I-B CRISPR-associated endonuclease Cas1b [Saccharicrinis fermentans]GAF02873.1 CRISPR-associated endonuclease Cas1 [Saccharicrinis fermentans DSM 9555 = JCM 21142]
MKKTYYLFNPGRLSRKDNTLKFTPVDEEGNELKPRYLPVEHVDQLYVLGSLDANSALYNFLGKNDIAVHFYDYYENYTGSFAPKCKLLSGKMLIAQTQSYLKKSKRLEIAQSFIEGASFNMLKNLKYYDNRGKDLMPVIDSIELLRKKLHSTMDVNELMGIEGNIRKNYYDAFNLIINDHEMGIRTKQPPLNIVNSLLSFGNMMCYSECLRAIQKTQLEPTISFLHEPGERRFSLALDLAEVFKPFLVDRVIFKVLNKKEIQVHDFEEKLNRIVLKEKGKKKFIQAFEKRLEETIKHRSLKRNVSYKHLIKLECYKLQKHLLGMDLYKPFKIYW